MAEGHDDVPAHDLEIWTVGPEQLDGEVLSAHAVVMPAPESAAAMDATAIALAVRPLRNISGPSLQWPHRANRH